MTQDDLLGLVRQVMILIGGILVGRGVLRQSEVEAVITLALIAVSSVWMLWSKRRLRQETEAKIRTALFTPPPRDPELDQ